MQLNITTDYAVRSVLYLTIAGHMASAAEIAEHMHIPRQYLTTMARRLKDTGLIQAQGGKLGGYYLARPPEDITLLDVIRATEGTMNLNRCLEHDKYCSRFATEECPVREVYESLQEMVESYLGSVTMADLKNKLTKGKLPANAGRSEQSSAGACQLPKQEDEQLWTMK